MTKKRFKLSGDQIQQLVRGGGCIASDKITVGGEKVAYMVRDKPSRKEDSGWVFTAGTETQAYMDNASNFEVYAVNTIANYDRDIIPFLDAPPGSKFERRANRGPLVPCDGTVWPVAKAPAASWPPPGFPIVEGEHVLTKSWALVLPERFARRVEEGSLVLWRPGLTLWINAFNNDRNDAQAVRLAGFKRVISPEATHLREVTANGVSRLTYRLVEDNVHSLNALVVSEIGHLQASIYFDVEADAATAERLAASITAR